MARKGSPSMIICINCTPDTKARMDSLLAGDNYSNYSELVAMAVESLWMLEREVSKKGGLVIGEYSLRPVPLASSPPAERAKPPNPGGNATVPGVQTKSLKAAPKATMSAPIHIPQLFLSDGLDSLSATTSELSLNAHPDQAFTLDRWLFGQFNKLLPIKANCRALLRIAAEHLDGIPLGDIAPPHRRSCRTAWRLASRPRPSPPNRTRRLAGDCFSPQRYRRRKKPRPLRQSVRRQRQQPGRSLRVTMGLPFGRAGAGSGRAPDADRTGPAIRAPDESHTRRLPNRSCAKVLARGSIFPP